MTNNSLPEFCFGVRPGAQFTVRDHLANFIVVNYGDKLIRVTVEVLEHGPQAV